MVDPISGSGGVSPVKQVNKVAPKEVVVEAQGSGDSVSISDDAIVLAQAAAVGAQLADDAGAVLSDSAQNIDALL